MAATIPTNGIVLNSGLNVADGDITLADGHGINFAADANATNMSAELLDDYEEGTWTGVFKSNAGNMTMNSSYETGRYIKVGRLVTVYGYFAANGNGSADTSQSARLHGLPFDIAANATSYGGGAMGYFTAMALSSGGVPAYYLRPGDDGVSLTQLGIGTTDVSSMTIANISSDGAIMFSAHYYTTS